MIKRERERERERESNTSRKRSREITKLDYRGKMKEKRGDVIRNEGGEGEE